MKGYIAEHTLLDIAPVAVTIINGSGKIVYANQLAENILGLPKEDITQLTYNDPNWVITDFNGQPFDEEQLPFTQALRSRAKVFDIKHAIKKPTGELVYLSINASPIILEDGTTGVIATFNDISSEVQTQKQLESAEMLYSNLFDNMIDEVHLWKVIRDESDSIIDWRLIDINPAGLQKWNTSKEDVLGKTVNEIFGKDTHKQFLSLVEEIISTGKAKQWESYFAPTGELLSMNSTPFGDYFLSTGRDISHAREIEIELLATQAILSSSLNSPKDIVIVSIDSNFNYLYFNDAHKQSMMTAYDIEVEIGMNLLECISDKNDIAKTKRNFTRAMEGESHSTEEVFGDKVKTYFETIYNPTYDKENNIIGASAFARDISDRKVAEEELLKNQELLKRSERLLQSSESLSKAGGWEYIVETGEMYWTPELYKIHEFPLDSSINHIEESINCYLPEDRAIIQKAFEQCVAEGKSYDLVFPFVTYNGNKKWIRTQTQPITRDGKVTRVLGSLVDITEQKLVEIELNKAKVRAEESENRLIEAQMLSHVGNWDYTHATGEVTWSKELYNIFERPHHLPAPNYTEQKHYYTPESFATMDKAVQAVMEKGEPYEIELDIITANGDIKHIISKGRAKRNDSGKIIGSYGTAQDITERKKLEADLLAAKLKAEENDQLKTAFLQNISHEIRTPLNAICGFSQMLERNDLPESKKRNYISIIQNSSDQLLSIISDVLAVSSLETKQEQVNRKPISVNQILVELLAIFEPKAKANNIALYLTIGLSDDQSLINSDDTKLRQIITNLLANSVKFTRKGQIEFGYSLKDSDLEFFVKDTGIGIPADKHETIFERFRQADDSIAVNYGGTGLGLSISKGYAELLGGKMRLESQPGKGSTFYFTIPYNPIHPLPIKEKTNAVNILVAEDDEVNFLVIEGLLHDVPVNLIHAKNGQEAIEYVRENPDIQLVLMDIKMPVLSGDEAAKQLKQIHPELPILAQSGYDLGQKESGYEGIFDDFITKPIKLDILLQKVSQFVTLSPEPQV